jgi:nucleoside 2-deoxyribosyltransferase
MTTREQWLILGEDGVPTQTALNLVAANETNSALLALWINRNLKGQQRHCAFDRLVNAIARHNGHDQAVDIFEAECKEQHMEYPTLYLCGPINGCTDAEANDWRTLVKENWPGKCIDPMKRDYRGKEAEAFREIVELDKIEVAACDVMLVNYDKPSVGTSMEILYAWERGKRIVVVCKPDAVISPWLRYHAHHFANSFADALEHIRAV